MTLAPPRFRQDVIIGQQATPEGVLFVVKDPASGSFYRLGEVERFITDQCDGATPVEVVRQRAEAAFGAALPEATLAAFLGNLRQAGLLESPVAREVEPARRRPRIRGSPLYLRVPVCDPDRFLGHMVAKTHFFFTPQFLIVSSGIVLLALLTTVSHWSDLTQDLARLVRLAAVPAIVLTVFIVTVLHELAHGLACKRFGGEVHEFGFMLLYLQPASYCNVSDAWLFPEKARRLWVAFAGPYFELFLCAVAALTWRLTEAHTGVHFVALIVMSVSGIRTLFNLNPFLKMDGYYLLSDATALPNLRRRAFRYLGWRLKRLVGMRARGPTVSPRERRIFLAYGLAATIVSFAFLAYAVGKLGGFLAQDRPLAFAFGTGFLGFALRNRIRKLLPGKSPPPPAAAGGSAVVDMPPPHAPEERVPGSSDRRPARPRKLLQSRQRLIAFGAFGMGAALLLFGRLELKVRGPITVLPAEHADVRAGVEGIVEAVFVDEGDLVRAGQPIARVSDLQLRTELGKVEAQIEERRARLRLLRAGPQPSEIEVARAAVSTAEARLPYVRNRLQRHQTLFERDLVSRRELEVVEEEVLVAEQELAEAKGELRLLLSGTRPEEIDAMEAEVGGLETQRHFLVEQLENTQVLSPIAGIVATPSAQLHEMVHRHVQKGDLIAKVYDTTTATAKIAISEQEIADVRLGQSVLVKARAHPDKTFRGKVTAIGAVALSSPNPGAVEHAGPGVTLPLADGTRKMLVVTAEIDNAGLLLKPEMSGQAKVLCGRRSMLELVKRRLARTLKVEFWSWS